MSERHVVGFAVSAQRLWALVGSGREPDGLLVDAHGTLAALDHDLRRSTPPTTASALAREVLAGRPDEKRAAEVVRLLVPVLAGVGERVGDGTALWLQDTMWLDWRAVLDAIGLTGLASVWATSNLSWPWREGHRVWWPIVTELSPEVLARVEAEFDRTGDRWRELLDALPEDAFVDEDGEPLDEPEDAREELAEVLDLAADWVRRAVPTGLSLVLVTDGDL
ncbi:hypothetical protein [Actinosynnema sp. NPDC020468]|uniref:hypothetical protein n=1 Tax=Actinosynnema sp. NPDC020468 TaxID=3154488 RepID=UPI0033F8C184